MRIATFNILNGRTPKESSVDEARYADAIASLDADVLALQEVDRNQPRSGGADLTAIAADAMGAVDHRFEPVLQGPPGAWSSTGDGDERPGGPAYGIALLSRYPVLRWDAFRLPRMRTRSPYLLQERGAGVGARGTASRPARRAGHAARPGARAHHPSVLPAVVQRPPAADTGPPGGAVRGADSPCRRPQPAPPSGCASDRDATGRGVSPSRRRNRPCSSTTSWWPEGCTPCPAGRCRCRCRTTWPSSPTCSTTRRSG